MRTSNKWITALGATALLVVAVQLNPQEVTAADHLDAPATQADAAADIADFYAWPVDDGLNMVTIMTYAAGLGAGADPVYDPDILYTFHIDTTATVAENNDLFDNDNDNESDVRIYVRFGQNGAGEWGMQVHNCPGAADEIFEGPVGGPVTDGDCTCAANIYDDPFFFDFDGFVATAMNLLDDTDAADAAFSSLAAGMAVDTFAGSNAMGIVCEFPTPESDDNFLQVWATTGVR